MDIGASGGRRCDDGSEEESNRTDRRSEASRAECVAACGWRRQTEERTE